MVLMKRTFTPTAQVACFLLLPSASIHVRRLDKQAEEERSILLSGSDWLRWCGNIGVLEAAVPAKSRASHALLNHASSRVVTGL